MFKWPGNPSPKASAEELADFVEFMAWQKTGASSTEVSRLLGRIDENDYADGIPEEEESDTIVAEAFAEVQRRSESCQGGYPFVMAREGRTLRLAYEDENEKHIIYKYLLLATRLNMNNNRIHANFDGTLIFEELSAETARSYLGARAEGFVLGTANQGHNFPARVNDLCRQLREGGEFIKRNYAPPTERDGKLDIVAWKPFSDLLPGKLITFGQCKTGTNYRDTLTQLQPDAFCTKWMRDQIVPTPVRAFFVAEALLQSGWYNIVADSGLLFDRCRIVDFCDGISRDTFDKVISWTAAAAAATGLPPSI